MEEEKREGKREKEKLPSPRTVLSLFPRGEEYEKLRAKISARQSWNRIKKLAKPIKAFRESLRDSSRDGVSSLSPGVLRAAAFFSITSPSAWSPNWAPLSCSLFRINRKREKEIAPSDQSTVEERLRLISTKFSSLSRRVVRGSLRISIICFATLSRRYIRSFVPLILRRYLFRLLQSTLFYSVPAPLPAPRTRLNRNQQTRSRESTTNGSCSCRRDEAATASMGAVAAVPTRRLSLNIEFRPSR